LAFITLILQEQNVS